MSGIESFHLEPSTARAFSLLSGGELTVIDPLGKQVADLVAFCGDDTNEWLSSGRTLDYAGTLRLTEGHILYSNRSNPMLEILSDSVGRHDFMFAPCSREMFHRQYGEANHPNCLDELAFALREYGISSDRIPTPFNIFMNVHIEPGTGDLEIREPLSGPGSRIVFRAQMDLVLAVSACSAEKTNAGALGPIDLTLTRNMECIRCKVEDNT
ncbi:MAG: urea carboxylase-associated family protein [Phycisphaerales bacterium]|nr:urea carboxylase-associated family protein [Phycisphaerales bacterium]